MFLVKLQTAEDINNYTPPQGYVVVFAQEVSGVVGLKCKTSTGAILTISDSSVQEPDPVEIDEANKTAVIPQAVLSDELPSTVELPQATVEGTVLVI